MYFKNNMAMGGNYALGFVQFSSDHNGYGWLDDELNHEASFCLFGCKMQAILFVNEKQWNSWIQMLYLLYIIAVLLIVPQMDALKNTWNKQII